MFEGIIIFILTLAESYPKDTIKIKDHVMLKKRQYVEHKDK